MKTITINYRMPTSGDKLPFLVLTLGHTRIYYDEEGYLRQDAGDGSWSLDVSKECAAQLDLPTSIDVIKAVK